nr:hypothetical protein [Tanacetum cinerariifolium]
CKSAKVTEIVFDNRSSDEENSLANDRFKKGNGYHEAIVLRHRVPHHMLMNSCSHYLLINLVVYSWIMRRKLEFNGKELVGHDKTNVECFNCHRRGNFSRDCKIARKSGNRSRDAGNAGSYQVEEEATDFAFMAFTSNPSSSSSSNSEAQLQLQSTLIQTQHQLHETYFRMQQTEIAELQETDRRHQAQMVETLRVMGDIRREMGDMQAELLAMREQP